MPPMPPMLLMLLPMLRRVGFTSSPLEDGYTMVTHTSELAISLLKWWSLQAFVDT